jgi:hypothetical protein
MRRWPLHAAFAAILVGSLATKYQATNPLAQSPNFEPAVISVARAHGLTFLGYTTIGDTDTRALRFEVPGCARSIMAVLLWTTFDQQPVVRSARAPGYDLRYVYIDRSWDTVKPFAVLTQRVKYAALHAFGLSPYHPSGDVLLLESPAECKFVNETDWRDAWIRQDLAASESTSDRSAQ